MPKYLFNAPSHHTFVVGDQTFSGGEEIECSEFEAAAADGRMILQDEDQATRSARLVKEKQAGINVDTSERE